MKRLIFVLIVLTALILQIQAQSEVRCEIQANLVDKDLNGTNVRKGAGKSFAIIGILPTERTDVLTIIASNGSWVKIRKAADEDGKVIFDKSGWVFASLLGMTVSWNPDDKLKKGNHNLYAEPNTKSRVLSRVPPESSVKVAGCDGKWAKVNFGRQTGWLAPGAQCTNTRTNCS